MMISEKVHESYTKESAERFLLARCFYEMTSQQISADHPYTSKVLRSLNKKQICPNNGVVASDKEKANWFDWKERFKFKQVVLIVESRIRKLILNDSSWVFFRV